MTDKKRISENEYLTAKFEKQLQEKDRDIADLKLAAQLFMRTIPIDTFNNVYLPDFDDSAKRLNQLLA